LRQQNPKEGLKTLESKRLGSFEDEEEIVKVLKNAD